MGVSVVIPTLNAADTLAAALRSVAAADEVVVADAGSADATLRVAREGGARIVQCERGRGRQLHAGAQAAVHDWLLFLHGDTLLAPHWRALSDAHGARRNARFIACFFRFKLDHPSWKARTLEALVALRGFVFALPYGDQGLLIHRDFYNALGGFRPLPLMEDVDIIRRIGRRRLKALACDAVTSARRWREDGWIARSARNLACLAMFSVGMPIDRIARFYER